MALGLCSLVLVASVITPAFGAATPLSIAKKALKTAKKANKTAKKANRRSKTALRRANTALSKAGTPGPKGDTGPRGATGVTGATGPSTLRYVFGDDTPLGASPDTVLAAVECPGEAPFPVGGGGIVFDTQGTPDLGDDTVVEDGSTVTADSNADPFGDATPTGLPGWVATIKNETNASTNLVAVATAQCLDSGDAGLAAAARHRRGRR